MSLDKNGFRFSFSEAVILKELLDAKIGEVSLCEYGVPPEVTLTKSGKSVLFNFKIPSGKPAEEISVDSEVYDGSPNPVSGGAVKEYVDTVADELGCAPSVTPSYTAPQRVETAASSSSAVLTENVFYVFPEMATLDISFATPENSDVVNEYKFRFRSGATATVLSLPSSVIGELSVEANCVYEVSVIDGYLVSQSWEVGV